MKARFRLFPRAGAYYCEDMTTRRVSGGTMEIFRHCYEGQAEMAAEEDIVTSLSDTIFP
jgi:hypothetical protein